MRFGETLSLQESRIFEQAGNFLSCLSFGIDDQRQRKHFAHGVCLLNILRITDTGNGMHLRIHRMHGNARKQVDFIGVGRRDENIHLINSRFFQHRLGCGVSLQGDHVISAHDIFQHFSAAVDQCYIMSLGCQFISQRLADFSCSGHKYFHRLSSQNLPYHFSTIGKKDNFR